MCACAETGSMMRERVQLNLGNGARSTLHSDTNRAKYRRQAPWHPALGLQKVEDFESDSEVLNV